VKDLLAQFIVCHLVGDFILQNHWMQAKSSSSLVCTAHVFAYSVPFWVAACYFNMPIQLWMLWAIFIEHWLQDRFQLHRHWMDFWQQTPVEQWPSGPLALTKPCTSRSSASSAL